jgi:hypothetical protein
MQVEIVGGDGQGAVKVDCGGGGFTARWHGELPAVGSTHHVELDVGGVATWGTDIYFIDDTVGSVADGDGCLLVSGLVTELGSDDVLVMDVGGTVVMIDTEGDPPLGVIGRHVTVQARDVTLYPYDI